MKLANGDRRYNILHAFYIEAKGECRRNPGPAKTSEMKARNETMFFLNPLTTKE